MFKKSVKTITKEKDFKKLKNNQLLGEEPKLINSSISFNGKNNILYCEQGVTLKDCNIRFEASNSLIYLSTNYHAYVLEINIRNNSVCYIDKNCYFNNNIKFIFSEEKNIFIGSTCLFASNICFRVADPHLIYDIKTKERINLSKSIYVGDHVWFGQNVIVLKGTQIGSGTILAAGAVVSNSKLSSNSIYGGVGIKKIKDGIFWDEKNTHRWTKEYTNKYLTNKDESFIYNKDKKTIKFDDIEKKLSKLNTSIDKLEYLQGLTKEKNRFYIE